MMYRLEKLILFIAVACFIIPFPALAVIPTISKNICDWWGIYCTGAGPTDRLLIITYIWNAIDVVFAFLATIAAAALIYYGIIYIISQGEEDETRRAKKGIVYALMGIIIVGLAAWIVNAVLNL